MKPKRLSPLHMITSLIILDDIGDSWFNFKVWIYHKRASESSDENNLGVCVDPDTEISGMVHIVSPSLKERSVMYYRMNTTAEEFRMPLLGRSIIHEESVTLIGEWIDGLTNECD